MIPSSAALPVAFGEQPPVLRSGQRQGADQEPPSARLSEGRPGYLVGSRLHRHRHPAPIAATPPTDLRVTAILLMVIQAMDIRPIHHRGMDTQVIPVLPVTPVPRAMDTMGMRDTQLIPVPRPMNIMVMRGTPLRLLHRITDTKAKGDILLRLDPRPTNTTATRDTPLILRQAMDTKATGAILLIPVRQPLNTMGMRDTPPIRQTTNTRATEHTRPTLVPLAMATRGTSEKPRCRRLQVMNTRTRRRLPAPFPSIDHRRSSSAAPDH